MVLNVNLGASTNTGTTIPNQEQAAQAETNVVWVFSYVADNLEQVTKTFRKREKCEAFAINYMSQVYNYTPTGDRETDLTALEELWRLNEENDAWFTSLCPVQD